MAENYSEPSTQQEVLKTDHCRSVGFHKNTSKMSTKKNNQNQITVIVKAEKIYSIINTYFNKISEDQWSLLASGSVDLETQATLNDMLSEIYQFATADVLNTAMPMIEKQIAAHVRTKTDNETVIVSLEDSISDGIAAALNVPPEKCESSVELTALIGGLISQKVNAVISKIAETKVWPPHPAVYISGSTLYSMMCRAVACLRRYLKKLKNASLRLCCQPKKHTQLSGTRSLSISEIQCEELEDYVCQDEKYTIHLPTAVKWIPQGVYKDCQIESEETPGEYSVFPTSHRFPLHIAAPETGQAKICTFLKSDILGESLNASDSSRNMEQAVDEVGDNITSKSETSEATDDESRANRMEFYEFAQKQFNEMISKMKEAFKTREIKFLVILRDALQRTKPDFDKGSTSNALGATTQTTATRQSPDLDFGTFKSQVDNFYHNPALKNLNSKEIREFSEELTDKLYSHVMRSHFCNIPFVPKSRIRSDSILSRKEMRDTQTGSTFSPEVLYAMTEDAVGKFIRKISLCNKNEKSDQICDSDEELNSQASQTSEESCFNLMPLGLRNVNYLSCDDDCSPPSSPECLLFNKSYGFEVLCQYESPTTSISSESFSGSSEESIPASIGPLSITTQLMTDNLITSLFVRLVSNSTKEFRKSLKIEEVKEVMYCLTEKVLENRRLKGVTVRANNDNMEHFIKEMVQDLHEKIGSPEVLLTAAVDPCSTHFDEAVLAYLESNASDIPTSKRYTFAEFFSEVGKYFERPFKCPKKSQ